MNYTNTNTGAGANAGRREAAAREARDAETFAVSSASGLGKVNRARTVTTIPVERIHYLAQRIHSLGERPLAELIIELAAGGSLHGVLERYAQLAPLADFIRAFGGEQLPGPRVVSGERR